MASWFVPSHVAGHATIPVVWGTQDLRIFGWLDAPGVPQNRDCSQRPVFISCHATAIQAPSNPSVSQLAFGVGHADDRRTAVTMPTGSGSQPSASGGKEVSWAAKVFRVNPAGLHWGRGVMILDIMLIPIVIFWAIGHDEYLLSALMGTLYTAMVDSGGSYGLRVSRLAVFGLIGAALTALGFGLGGDAWGWLVLAAFAVTLIAGLAIDFGLHRFVAATNLYQWFLIALAFSFSLHHIHRISFTWAQVLAWVGGSALWITVTFIGWLIRGRKDAPPPFTEMPSDTSRHLLTPPLLTFVLLRALAIALIAALAFGLNLSHGAWFLVAATIAMKPSLGQTTLASVQRVVGVLMGAIAAALILLIPANEHGQRLLAITHALEAVALLLFMHAMAIFFWNYAYYAAAEAAGVLILLDLPQPTNYAAEGYRVLWTLCGVGIATLVMLLADRLSKSKAKTPPPSGSQRAVPT
jgi:hypothetical protein